MCVICAETLAPIYLTQMLILININICLDGDHIEYQIGPLRKIVKIPKHDVSSFSISVLKYSVIMGIINITSTCLLDLRINKMIPIRVLMLLRGKVVM